jgi:polar amino acid transport system substrate-binding protein
MLKCSNTKKHVCKSENEMMNFFKWLCLLSIMTVNHSLFAETTYTIKQGDTLSSIAKKFYNNAYKWPYLYRANKDIILDQNTIQIGWILRIPDIAEVNQPERSRKEIIKLVTGNDYTPFTDEKLPKGGMFTEIVKMTFEAMGYETHIEFWNWAYGYKATKEGIFGATFPYLDNKERRKSFHYSQPLYELLIFPFVNKDSSLHYETLQDLKGLTLCRPEGYYTHDIQQLIDNNSVKLLRPKELETCFNMLKSGKVDVVPVNELTGQSMIYKMGLNDELKMLDENAISLETLHVIFSKFDYKGRILLYKFDRSISNLKETGILQEIISKHLENFYQSLEKESN